MGTDNLRRGRRWEGGKEGAKEGEKEKGELSHLYIKFEYLKNIQFEYSEN